MVGLSQFFCSINAVIRISNFRMAALLYERSEKFDDKISRIFDLLNFSQQTKQFWMRWITDH